MNVLEWPPHSGHMYKKASTAKGGEYHGSCPACGGNDRFHVWPAQKDGGTWWCRGCDKGGDLIEYLMVFDGMSFPEACKAAGRELPKQQDCRTPQLRRSSGDNWQPKPTAAPVDAWREHAGKFVDWCHEQLLAAGDDEGSPLAFLAARGITRDSAVRFRLGWNAGEKGKDQYRAREAWGLETVMKGDKKKKLWLPIGLVIPYFVGEQLRRVRIRIPNERRTADLSTPYYVVPGSSMEAFLINPERQAFFITEAELDGILIAQEAGDLTGVVAIGNSSTRPTEEAHRLLTNSLHIAVALDYDAKTKADGTYENAGGVEWYRWWREHYSQAERYPVPVGKDPGDAFKAGCDIRAWIKEGLPPIFQVPGRKQEEVNMAFNSNRAHQLLKDTRGRIIASFKSEAWQWLQVNRPEVIHFIKVKEAGIEDLFEKENEQGIVRELQILEAAYSKAWAVYDERPPVMARCKMEGGDCVCCGNCREGEE